MATSIEQAVINALARYLQTSLDVGIITPIVADAAEDEATAVALANALKAALNAHMADAAAHLQPDATNTVTDDDATDLDTAGALLNVIKAATNAHQTQAGVHAATFTASPVLTDDATDETTTYALANALKTAINAHLLTSLARVVVSDHWPEASLPLPPKAITILPAGPRQDELLSAQVVDTIELEDAPATATYRYELAYVTQPLQVDVWTHYRGDRDDLVAQLEPLFRAGAVGLGTGDDEPSTEFQLQLGDGWEGTLADYLFSGASITDADDSIKRSEYRAMYQGSANSKLTVTATSARMARMTLQRVLTP